MIKVIRRYLARRRLQKEIKEIKKRSYDAGVTAQRSLDKVAAAISSFAEGMSAAKNNIAEGEKEDT